MTKQAYMIFRILPFIAITLAFLCAGCGDKAPGTVTVVMETTAGDITLELYPANAPLTVENFITYARDGFYEGTLFHRVMPRFVIQGGGYDEFLKPKPTRDPVRNESPTGILNERGTIAMARSGDPHSATSQFYINLKHNTHLDTGYTVFGRVTAGMDVVDAIAAREIRNMGGAFTDITAVPVVITAVRVLE